MKPRETPEPLTHAPDCMTTLEPGGNWDCDCFGIDQLRAAGVISDGTYGPFLDPAKVLSVLRDALRAATPDPAEPGVHVALCADIEPHGPHGVPNTWRGLGNPFRCPGRAATPDPAERLTRATAKGTAIDVDEWDRPLYVLATPDPAADECERSDGSGLLCVVHGRALWPSLARRCNGAATPDPAEPLSWSEQAFGVEQAAAINAAVTRETPEPLTPEAERALNRLVPLLPSTARVHEDYAIIRAALRAATPDPAESLPPLPLNDSNGPWCGCGQRLGHAVPNVDCTPDPAEHGHTRKVCEQCWKAGYDAAATHDPAADER